MQMKGSHRKQNTQIWSARIGQSELANRRQVQTTGFADGPRPGPTQEGIYAIDYPQPNAFVQNETTKNCAITVPRNLLLLPTLTSLTIRFINSM